MKDDRQPALRVTVSGPSEVVVEVEQGEVAAPTGSDPEVRLLPTSPEERAAGRARCEVTVGGWVLEVRVESAARAALLERAGQVARDTGPRSAAVVRAQIPGRVVRLWVADGDTVEAGQRLLAIEAMKMENEVRAPHAGVVEAIRVGVGGSVELGDELLTVR